MSLVDFPDVALLRIFDYVPLSHLLTAIPSVCHRWSTLQSAGLLQRRSLSLFIGSYPLHLIHRSSFVMPCTVDASDGSLIPYRHSDTSLLTYSNEPTRERLQWMVNTFPNITQLEIAQRDIHFATGIDGILYMLEHFAEKLTHLKLWISYCEEDVPTQKLVTEKLRSLTTVINSLPSLLHLTFMCRHQLVLPGTQGDLDLSIFRQLKTLQWFTFDSAGELRPSLLEYAQPNVNLQQIELQNLLNNHSLEQYLLFDESFACRFANFDISFSSITAAQLEAFAGLFSHLTTLYIYLEGISMSQYATCLAQLPELAHLRMDVNFEYYRLPRIDKLESVAQLTSVVFLSMRVITTAHTDLSLLYPHWIFPHLLVLQIVNLNEACSIDGCGYEYPNVTVYQRRECTRKLVKPFRSCASLVKVCVLKGFTTDETVEWEVGDF